MAQLCWCKSNQYYNNGTQLTAKNAQFFNKNFRYVELQQLLNEYNPALSLTEPIEAERTIGSRT